MTVDTDGRQRRSLFLTAVNDGRNFGNRQRRPTVTAVKEHRQHTAKIIEYRKEYYYKILSKMFANFDFCSFFL